MNTKLYKQVYALAGEMMDAAESDNDALFDRLYQQLKTLCEEHEGDTVKNHPVQWETLADFTGDCAEALLIYQKALAYAEAIDAYDYIVSINYAMALLLFEEADFPDEHRLEKALAAAQVADSLADKVNDEELQREIKNLLAALSQ
ncbi:hypothetical protein [Oceanicoccus sagamiensis]|nr:hypothetical protein [Oceanicoccus sagamiensis]